MELSVSRLRCSVIWGSLWWSFTRTYSSHQFCLSLCSTSHVWLAGSWGRLLGSKLWLAQVGSSLEKTWTAGWPLEVSRACCDKWAFLLRHTTRTYTHARTQTHLYGGTKNIYTHAQTGRTDSARPLLWTLHHSKTAEAQLPACRLCFQTWVNLQSEALAMV